MGSDRWLLISLILFNTLLKFSWLGVNELGGDEPFTVYWSQRSLAEIFSMLRTENNPPLYFLLIKAWSMFVPLEEAWLRVPSAIFSALTVWPLFLLARVLGNRTAAVATVLLFTFSNHHFAFAHEVRGYTLLLLLTVFSGWWMVRSAQRTERVGPWNVLTSGIAFVAMTYTHFFGWLVIALIGACVLSLKELRPVRRHFLMALAMAIVAFVPYALIFFHRAGESLAHGTWVKPHGAEEIWHMVRRWSNQPVVTIALLVPIVITLVRDGLKPLILRFTLLWWLLPLLGLWLVQWLVPVYVDRYLLFASPGFYLIAGYGLANVVNKERLKWVVPAIGVLAMAITFMPWKDNGHRPSAVAAQVRSWQRSAIDPPVLVYPFWYKLNFQWAMDRSHFADPPWTDPWSNRWNEEARSSDDPSPGEVVVVSALSPDDSEWSTVMTEMGRRFQEVEITTPDAGVRVLRFHR